MKTIKSIVKVISTIVVCLGFVLGTGEAENASVQLLWTGGCIVAIYLGYKALCWADPSLLNDDEEHVSL